MKDFDLITFDCYGTLIDWETGIFDAFRNEAAKDGRQLERGSVIDGYQICRAIGKIAQLGPFPEVGLKLGLRSRGKELTRDIP